MDRGSSNRQERWVCKTVGKGKAGLASVLCCRHTGAPSPNHTSADVTMKTFKDLRCHWIFIS